MIKFIFEDNPNVAISYLLKKCYNGENIEFSCSNTFLPEKLDKMYNTDDIFILYMDYTCNDTLYNDYLQIRKKILKNCKENHSVDNPSNVFIVCIPCIEYIVLKMLHDYDYIDNNNFSSCFGTVDKVLAFDKSTIKSIYNTKNKQSKKSNKKVEVQLKYYLTSLSNSLDNYNVYKDGEFKPDAGDRGSFYISSSASGVPNIKAEQLYTTLPVFDDLCEVGDSYINILKGFGIKHKHITLDELDSEMRKFYSNMAVQLGVRDRDLCIRVDTSL